MSLHRGVSGRNVVAPFEMTWRDMRASDGIAAQRNAGGAHVLGETARRLFRSLPKNDRGCSPPGMSPEHWWRIQSRSCESTAERLDKTGSTRIAGPCPLIEALSQLSRT